jgi:hypothetical protein
MFNIASEMSAFMTVIKGKNVKGVNALEPEQLVSYSRQGPFERLEPAAYPLAHTSFSIKALLKRLFLPVG